MKKSFFVFLFFILLPGVEGEEIAAENTEGNESVLEWINAGEELMVKAEDKNLVVITVEEYAALRAAEKKLNVEKEFVSVPVSKYYTFLLLENNLKKAMEYNRDLLAELDTYDKLYDTVNGIIQDHGVIDETIDKIILENRELKIDLDAKIKEQEAKYNLQTQISTIYEEGYDHYRIKWEEQYRQNQLILKLGTALGVVLFGIGAVSGYYLPHPQG